MLARLTRLGFSCIATPSQSHLAREHFEQHNYLRLPGFIEPGLLRVIQHYLALGKFETKEYVVGRELRLSNSPIASIFYILMNDPKLFRLLRQVTGCGPIRYFNGRFYQMAPRQRQAFTWHNDLQLNRWRKIAISINLSEAPYQGGNLQIRDTSHGKRESVPNPGFGDAIIFRVAKGLEHRVTRVVGKFPKTAYSGWFSSRPRHASVQRELFSDSESAIASQVIRNKSLVLPAPHDVVKIPKTVVSQTSGHETFVANIDTSMCYGLNQTGSRIWELLVQGVEMRSISDTLAREYGASRRHVERDVLALSRELAQRHLIKVVHTSSS
jgi:hypothetical protein